MADVLLIPAIEHLVEWFEKRELTGFTENDHYPVWGPVTETTPKQRKYYVVKRAEADWALRRELVLRDIAQTFAS